MKQLFPKEIIENSVEVHQFKHSKKSKIVYSILLVAILLTLISLPFIKITIYNTSQGLIRSDKERMTIQTSSSGNIFFHQLKNNLRVQKGDTLLIIDNIAMNHKIENTTSQLNETNIFIEDLKLLTSPKKVELN